MKEHWTDADAAAAQAQGWGLSFVVTENRAGKFDLTREILPIKAGSNAAQARAAVFARARQNDPLALRALRLCVQHSMKGKQK